jgi:alkylation response protein AidB-like acyl-CoA dehydrogenase
MKRNPRRPAAAAPREAGSDLAALRTSAGRDGDHYIVNGTKRFITNAPQAGPFTLMARTERAAPPRGHASTRTNYSSSRPAL